MEQMESELHYKQDQFEKLAEEKGYFDEELKQRHDADGCKIEEVYSDEYSELRHKSSKVEFVERGDFQKIVADLVLISSAIDSLKKTKVDRCNLAQDKLWAACNKLNDLQSDIEKELGSFIDA